MCVGVCLVHVCDFPYIEVSSDNSIGRIQSHPTKISHVKKSPIFLTRELYFS
jgi:hypothetical protein